MGILIGLNLLNFFNFFAFKTEKVHFTDENRARTAKLSVPSIPREKYIAIMCTLDMWENFFGEAVRHSSKLFIVKKDDNNLSD